MRNNSILAATGYHERRTASKTVLPYTIAVDFDGTLTLQSTYPNIGEPNTELICWLKNRQSEGCKLILSTCRTGVKLADAVAFCEKFGLHFDAINENLSERILAFGGDCRKISADLTIDDRTYRPDEIMADIEAR